MVNVFLSIQSPKTSDSHFVWQNGYKCCPNESIKKYKVCNEIFFSDNVEWSSKNLWKMIAEVKANKKQVTSEHEIQSKNAM